MSKAKIKQDHGNGLYYVEVQVDKSYTMVALSRLNAKIEYVQAQQVILESELSDLQLQAWIVKNNNQIIIDLYKTAIIGYEEDIKVYNSELSILKQELSDLIKSILDGTYKGTTYTPPYEPEIGSDAFAMHSDFVVEVNGELWVGSRDTMGFNSEIGGELNP